jgi:hypothetical protein
MKPWYFAATFAAGFALCYAISGWNQFTASDKLKQAEADKQEAQTQYKRTILARDRLDKTRSKIYAAIGLKEEDQIDHETDSDEVVDAKLDALTDALAKKLIEQRDAAK